MYFHGDTIVANYQQTRFQTESHCGSAGVDDGRQRCCCSNDVSLLRHVDSADFIAVDVHDCSVTDGNREKPSESSPSSPSHCVVVTEVVHRVRDTRGGCQGRLWRTG
jgi:hypothetical protein